ncbi:MAG: hypothetical protein U9Q93_00505 [Pseudomonadota bacterium]|jgi:hypothetical protein|nr:hypothetical protein [Pseudomonadota bacterium]
MHELTGPERPLAGAVAERRGITATVPLAFLVAFLVILLQLGDILEIGALVGFQACNDVLNEDRFGTHVADQAEGVDTLVAAPVDHHPRAALTLVAVVKQLRIDHPHHQRGEADQYVQNVLILRYPVKHA